ncbi:hypothetical protein [Hymenobacter ruricola]|uniref:DUF1634 domain-containing protein n=1 Tax=Hymenobacter ruricola TaxID=2791023 RepID=A0ABS0I821_9BACT|nr:hypothetical protein [Hymenobacter ruricola]MBF9222722.1 hypothetical protein [Hymenobacter ruricola]
MRRNNYLLAGWVLLLITAIASLYFYLFHFEATLYFIATSSERVKDVSHMSPQDEYELYDTIIPYKQPAFFTQFALVISLFIYTIIIRRYLDLIVVRVVYWITLLLMILFSLLTLAMPFIPYGGMVG